MTVNLLSSPKYPPFHESNLSYVPNTVNVKISIPIKFVICDPNMSYAHLYMTYVI